MAKNTEDAQPRELTELEQEFVKQAEAGFFHVEYNSGGAPCAYGAPNTDNLFSMDVDSEPVGGGEWAYYLHNDSGSEED